MLFESFRREGLIEQNAHSTRTCCHEKIRLFKISEEPLSEKAQETAHNSPGRGHDQLISDVFRGKWDSLSEPYQSVSA